MCYIRDHLLCMACAAAVPASGWCTRTRTCVSCVTVWKKRLAGDIVSSGCAAQRPFFLRLRRKNASRTFETSQHLTKKSFDHIAFRWYIDNVGYA